MRYRGVSVKAGATENSAFTLGDMTVPHVITVANQTSTLDGATAVATLEAGSIGTQSIPVLIGCSWAERSTVPGMLSQRYCHAKWYSVRFDDVNGNALMNLIPALYGESEAVLYDSVDKRILRNQGVGAMTYGGTPGDAVDFIAKASSVPVLLTRNGIIIFVK
jgi:hypothetical protein